MEAFAPHSMHNAQHLDSPQLQVPHGVQVNHDRRGLPVVEVAGQLNDHGWSAVETMNLGQSSEVTQVTELDVDVSLASMNLDDGPATSIVPQSATSTTTPLEPSSIVGTNISAGAVLDACTTLKNDLDAAHNAYRQSKEVMLWHAANVCRVNMEYIRALQAANRVLE